MDFENSNTCFWKVLRGCCFLLEKLPMQLTNLSLASFLSSSLVFWILDSKSVIRCLTGSFSEGKGIPKFFPKLCRRDLHLPIVTLELSSLCVGWAVLSLRAIKARSKGTDGLKRLYL